MATGVCYTQSGDIKRYESKLFSYYSAKPLLEGNNDTVYFQIYSYDEDRNSEYIYSIYDSEWNIVYPYYYTYFTGSNVGSSSKFKWYSKETHKYNNDSPNVYSNTLVTKYGLYPSYQYAYFGTVSYYSVVPDISTIITTNHSQKYFSSPLNKDYAIISWWHNDDQNGTTIIEQSKLVCKDYKGNIIPGIKINIEPICYIGFQESAKNTWRKEITTWHYDFLNNEIVYIKNNYDHKDSPNAVQFKGCWNTRAFSYIYSYLNYYIYGQPNYDLPMVLMNYTHGKDENSWSTVTVGYVSATVDSAYSYITSGTCFYTYIWEYNGKYSSSFNSTYYGNKKLISCIRDYKHSADENGDSTVSFVYMNCMI